MKGCSGHGILVYICTWWWGRGECWTSESLPGDVGQGECLQLSLCLHYEVCPTSSEYAGLEVHTMHVCHPGASVMIFFLI